MKFGVNTKNIRNPEGIECDVPLFRAYIEPLFRGSYFFVQYPEFHSGLLKFDPIRGHIQNYNVEVKSVNYF